VAVSPFVGGRAVKGPTELFCAQVGIESRASGIVAAYGEVLDGVVADETAGLELPALEVDTLMTDADGRRRVAQTTLDFARSLAD
jgi:LPPG:FO 2-phospho-L-lactate transferase